MKIDLNKMATDRSMCSYEAEIFPGLSYRMINPKVTCCILSVEGGHNWRKDADEINQAYCSLYPKLIAAALYK
uniref:Uncharacterized protein n=1 Tax=Ditylenchus dipsaci TaxID=166011 RepID=A0A915DRE7_9BILA